MNIKILNQNKQELDYDSFVFNGGEVSIKLKDNLKFKYESKIITIIARVQSSEELIKLALIKNALDLEFKFPVDLILPYIPYARQDRVCDKGESFSLNVFTDILNSLNFKSVTVFDPHSDVAPALINNVRVISQFDIFDKNTDLISYVMKNIGVFVSPDAGANKKTAKLAGYFGHQEFVRADKLRDLTNGQIKETVVYCDDLDGRNVMMVDDIADGGATFCFLAKELKKKNAGKIILFVTHGIFSKGFECFEDIDEIITTNSFQEFHNVPEKVEIYEIEKYI